MLSGRFRVDGRSNLVVQVTLKGDTPELKEVNNHVDGWRVFVSFSVNTPVLPESFVKVLNQ